MNKRCQSVLVKWSAVLRRTKLQWTFRLVSCNDTCMRRQECFVDVFDRWFRNRPVPNGNLTMTKWRNYAQIQPEINNVYNLMGKLIATLVVQDDGRIWRFELNRNTSTDGCLLTGVKSRQSVISHWHIFKSRVLNQLIYGQMLCELEGLLLADVCEALVLELVAC